MECFDIELLWLWVSVHHKSLAASAHHKVWAFWACVVGSLRQWSHAMEHLDGPANGSIKTSWSIHVAMYVLLTIYGTGDDQI